MSKTPQTPQTPPIEAGMRIHGVEYEVEEEEPLFEIVYTIHMTGSTKITARTPQQLDGRIEATYESLDVVDCEIDSHDEEIVPLNDAARNLLIQWGRITEAEKEPSPPTKEKDSDKVSNPQEEETNTEEEEAALLARLRECLKNDQVKVFFGECETSALLYLLDMAESAMQFPQRGQQ